MIWTRREDQLLKVANEALHLSYIVLRNSEGTFKAQAATADTVQPATVQVNARSVELDDAASDLHVGNVASGSFTLDADTATRPGPQAAAPAESGKLHVEAHAAADTMQPATVQVKVCSVEYNDAASNLPVGHVASGPQAAPAESGKHHVEAQAAAADTVQPAAEQVQVCLVKSNDAASNLPPGSMVTGDQSLHAKICLLYTSPSPRDVEESRMPSSA